MEATKTNEGQISLEAVDTPEETFNIDFNVCEPPRLKIGQKININVFGKKYKIIAGADQHSTVVKEIVNSDSSGGEEVHISESSSEEEETKAQKPKRKITISREFQGSSSSQSQSLDSDEEAEVSINESAVNQSELGDRVEMLSQIRAPDIKNLNIKKEIKRSLTFLFRFEGQVQSPQNTKLENNLAIPTKAKAVHKKSSSVRKLVLESLKMSTKDLFEQPPK